MLYERSFCLLACEFHISTNCELFAKQIEYLAVSAEQAFPVSASRNYQVMLEDGRYSIYEGDECHGSEHSPEFALWVLYPLVHQAAYALLSGYIRIHSGCVTYRGRRFLMVGDKGAGKTTLMLHLLYAGFEVQCDETVLLLDGEVVPFPRRFHIKQASLGLLPQLASTVDALPFFGNEVDANRIFAFDPAEMGFPWTITRSPVDAIFFLHANHGGETRIDSCSTLQMVQNLLPQSYATANVGNSGWVREICSMTDSAECYTLTLGDVGDAMLEFERRFG